MKRAVAISTILAVLVAVAVGVVWWAAEEIFSADDRSSQTSLVAVTQTETAPLQEFSPKGGDISTSPLSINPYEREDERLEVLEDEMRARLKSIINRYAPGEVILRDLVRMSCVQPANNVPFWAMGADGYKDVLRAKNDELVSEWPRTLQQAYALKCVERDQVYGRSL